MVLPMAPGRKRGANNKCKTSSELSLGDLVLAKVKGFPAWPAKVSKPEEWERAPDPKKYFVQFFGTKEINEGAVLIRHRKCNSHQRHHHNKAFVAPVDIQLFTAELKKKLQARSKGKTVKYFAQAVDEICNAFEDSEQMKSSGLGDNAVRKCSDPDGVIMNCLDPNVEAEGLAVGCASSHGSSLERCSAMQEGADSKKKSSAGEVEFSKEGLPKCNTAILLHVKDELYDVEGKADSSLCNKGMISARGARSSPNSGENLNDGRTGHGTDPSIAMGDSSHTNRLGNKQKGIMEGNKSKGSTAERKRKFNNDIHGDHAEIGGFIDGVPRTLSSGLSRKESSPVDDKSNLQHGGFKVSKLVKDKKYGEAAHLKEKNISQRGSGSDSVRITERSDQSKRKKHLESLDGATKMSSFKNGKRDSSSLNRSGRKSDKIPETKESLSMKAEDHMHPKSHKSTVVSDVPGDESVREPASESKSSSFHKSDVAKKRRAIRLCDEDEDGIPKTPVHGRSSCDVNASSSLPDSLQTDVRTQGNHSLIGQAASKPTSPVSLPEAVEKSEKIYTSSELDMNKKMRDRSRSEFASPKKSSPHVPASDNFFEELSTNKAQDKMSTGVSLNKGQGTSVKASNLGSGGSTLSHVQVGDRKCKQPSSAEKPKVVKKSQGQFDSALSGRLEEFRKDKSNSFENNKMDSDMSMKNLIAAAQAKRKQAQMQSLLPSNMISAFAATDIKRPKKSSPHVEHRPFSGGSNSGHVDAPGIHSDMDFVSPSGVASQAVSQDVGAVEYDEKQRSLGHQSGGGSLSGGTEAAVARDAFEGMIETLSRTKESIGRATRLAIDCAKYGIANEVVDLLIRKLESEPSSHRKVDLFFLVDSITQCSHNQKGIAGASYVPAIQEALPRLLGAAAPHGASARENRRQCLKVLRLWLERKILPESLLRRHMDDIGASNDDISSNYSFRRPSRAERAVDDPLREMEDMLVDEYGSNATFQLAGLFRSRAFDVDDEDDEDIPSTSCMGVNAGLAQITTESEVCVVTPSDKNHHVLEDVDGELEMEDVSGHQKHEVALSKSISKEIDRHKESTDGGMVYATDDDAEALTPEGSPPLPLEPLPTLPPLPSSPPPPLPPSCPPSPPPPPPSPPAQPPVPFLPISDPLSHVHPPSFPSQVFPQLSASLAPASQLSYQTHVPGGNQIVQMLGNAPQQSCFTPAGMSGLQNPSGYDPSRSMEYRHNALTTQPSQQFQPGLTAYSQGSFHALPPPQVQTFANQFSYKKPAVQQHLNHPYSHSYSSPSLVDNRMRFVHDENWTPSGGYKADSQNAVWANGARPPSCSAKFPAAEGYYRPSSEIPPSKNMGLQSSAPSTVQSGVPTLGHGNNHMLPPRPDVSAFNWRPG